LVLQTQETAHGAQQSYQRNQAQGKLAGNFRRSDDR
jgi:hypothetical protein